MRTGRASNLPNVAVIIPFFQERAGILARSLSSIYAQDVDPHLQIAIVVVDDGSPLAPTEDIDAAGTPPTNVTIRILKRANGGPAAARNTGLDAVNDVDAIAFLDSDDIWHPGHLKRGLLALRRAQLYFADNEYSLGSRWFDGLSGISRLTQVASAEGDDIYRIPGDAILPYFLAECIAHTSTVIFDARRIERMRFDEAQATAGEDHLFWISAAARSEHVAFSLRPMASRGHGVDMYRRALSWDNPECVRRIYFALMLKKKMLDRFCTTASEKAMLNMQIGILRRSIIYLFARNAISHAKSNARVFAKLLCTDLGFWLNLPRNAFILVSQKITGRFEFHIG